ncbi:MAG: hypothetical protein MUE51_02335, partial [Thermoleophilia bacterium]|nr:hypothetical protein [Thermoleophilia bacterium]
PPAPPPPPAPAPPAPPPAPGAPAAPPDAAFTAPAQADSLRPVVLSAGDTTGATGLRWDFDSDGRVDLASPPRDSTVRLTVPGATRLNVTMIATGASGATDTANRGIRFTGGRAPAQVTSRLPTVVESGPSAIATATAVLADRPCVDGVTVAFRLVAARGCFVRTADLADVPARERALGQRHYDRGQYAVPAVVASICRQAADGTLPQERCDRARKVFAITPEFHISRGTVKLNGITIRPLNGSAVVLFATAERLLASNAVMTWNGIPVKVGEIDMNLASQVRVVYSSAQRARDFPTGRAELLTFTGRDLGDIAGFTIDGAITLSIGADAGVRYSEGTLSLRLPPAFSVFGGGRGAPPSGQTTLRADNDRDADLDSLRISVPVAYIGSVRFSDLRFEYRRRGGIDGDTNPGTACSSNQWKATGTVFITGGTGRESGLRMAPPPSQNGVGFCDGSFRHAGGEFTFPDPRPVIFPGVTLDRVNFGLQLDPFLVRGGGVFSVGDTAVVEGAMLLAFPTPSRPYRLTERDAGAPLRLLAGRTFTSPTLAVGGNVGVRVPRLGTLGFGDAALMYSFPDYVYFGGNVRLVAPGLAVTGGVGGEMSLRTRLFQLGGGGQVCIGVDAVCVGADVHVGSRGFSACGDVGGLRPGAGYRFSDGYIGIWPIDGCKPSRFWITDVRTGNSRESHATQAGPITVTVAPDEGVKQIRLQGDIAAPSVTVRGPGGQALTVDDASAIAYSTGQRMGGIQEPEGRRTFVSLNAGPGRYTVEPAPGSARIVQVAASRKGFDSDFDASVSGSGGQRTLTYDLGGKGGEQQVTLFEEGNDVHRAIATLSGGKGQIRFTPAEGDARRRTIVAAATVNGVPIPEQRLATFRVQADPAVGRPSDVEVERRAGRLTVDWEPAPGATGYTVAVREANGEVFRQEVAAAVTRLQIPGLSQQFGGTVTVSARGDERDWSRPTSPEGYERLRAPFTVLQTNAANERREAEGRARRR